MKRIVYPTLLFIFCFSINLTAQLYISQNETPEQMMMDFFNTANAAVSNVNSYGTSVAYFEGANAEIELNAGIFLSTGDPFTAIGPNTQEGTSGTSSSGTDADLLTIASAPIQEYSAITMDLVPTTEELHFKYVFASEEYCEFVGSGFNDVFGFFISGPGYDGTENIAMLPNQSDPVEINSVNHTMNSHLFVSNSETCSPLSNENNVHIEFDGYTVVLNATMNVVPGETYDVKIAIADVGDSIYDSGVFIGIESLGGSPNLTPPAAFDFNVVDNELAITNNSRYATTYLWDFGDGTTSTEQTPPTHVYDTNEYTEYTVSLITQNYCCADTFTTTVAAFPTVNVVDPALKHLVLSPNPATDAFSLTGINRSVNVFAYDALGRMVWTNRVGAGEVVSLETWNRGIYTLKIVGEDPERPMIQQLLVQ